MPAFRIQGQFETSLSQRKETKKGGREGKKGRTRKERREASPKYPSVA